METQKMTSAPSPSNNPRQPISHPLQLLTVRAAVATIFVGGFIAGMLDLL
jgi:hypothetical protein